MPSGRTVLGEHEAPAHISYNLGKFEEAFGSGIEWIRVEPFSSRPFEFTAATAGIVEEFKRAIEIADQGLLLAPRSNHLRLSKAFALASTGKLLEAKTLLKSINVDGADKTLECFKRANEGLIAFREGDQEKARRLYFDAIQGFRSLKDNYNMASAAVFMAREAFRAKDPHALEILTGAKDILTKTPKASVANFVFLKAHKELGLLDDALSNKLLSESGIQLPRLQHQPIKWSTPDFGGTIKLTNN